MLPKVTKAIRAKVMAIRADLINNHKPLLYNTLALPPKGTS